MYTDFYRLSEMPFALVPDPRFLFLGSSHREALAHLLYGIEQGAGFIEVVGQTGTGKTTLCRTLLERVGEDVDVAFIFNPSGSEIELLTAISREFALPTTARSRSELIDELNRFLLTQKTTGRRVVLLIDEAQNLEPDVLEQIRLLSNLETEREKLIQIVLIGQPELDANLSRPDMRQLRQRVTVRWKLDPLNRREVRDYLEHRLRVAGLAGPSVFTPMAVQAIYRASRGVPRVINAVADRALLAGFSRGRRHVDLRTVRAAVRELPESDPMPWRTTMGIPTGLAGTLVGLGLVIGLVYVAWMPTPPGPESRAEVPPLPAVSSQTLQPMQDPVSERSDLQMSTPNPAESDPAWTDLERSLFRLSRGESAAQALNALVALWGYANRVRGEVEPGRFESLVTQFSALHVMATASDLEQLDRMDLPAILEMRLPEGGLRYVALLQVDSDSMLQMGLESQRFSLSFDRLQQLWTGRTYFLWTNYESLSADGFQTDPDAIRWLQLRLADLGYIDPSDGSGRFGSSTLEAVRNFQQDHALEGTGEVDTKTLITLYQVLHYGAPRLARLSGRQES